MKNLFLFSSLPKFTFSSSEFVQNKKTKVQINKNQMHTLSFLSQGFSLIHQLYSGSKRIFYLLHIYGLCTTTGYVFKKRAFCLLNIKCAPASWQRHVSVKNQSTLAQTLLQLCHNPTFIIIIHNLSGSSFNTAQSHLLKHSNIWQQ